MLEKYMEKDLKKLKKVFLSFYDIFVSSFKGSNNNLISILRALAILSVVSKEKVFLQALLDSIFLINS